MRKYVLILAGCLFLSACAHKTKNPVAEPVDFVAFTLGQAAEEAHSDLAMLASLRGKGLEPLLPPLIRRCLKGCPLHGLAQPRMPFRKFASRLVTNIVKWEGHPRRNWLSLFMVWINPRMKFWRMWHGKSSRKASCMLTQ